MKSIFYGIVIVCLSLSAGAAGKEQKNSAKKQKRGIAAAVVINPAGDRSLKCGSAGLNSYEGDLRIRNVPSEEGTDSFDIIYRITKKNGAVQTPPLAVTGRCESVNGNNACYLSRVVDVMEDFGDVVISGEFRKDSGQSEATLYMSHAVGNRAAETFETQCNSMPCVIDNFINTGKLSGNSDYNSCAQVRTRCVGRFVDQRSERWGTRTGSARIVNDDLSCNVEITDAQADGKSADREYCVLTSGLVLPAASPECTASSEPN